MLRTFFFFLPFLFLASIAPSNVSAGYVVLGAVEATVCKGFVVEFCTMNIKVDVAQDKN